MRKEGGQIIEWAAILADPDTYYPVQHNPIFNMRVLMEPGKVWDPDAEEVHGISQEELAQTGHPWENVLWYFLNWLESHHIKTWLNHADWWTHAHHTSRSQLRPMGHNLHFDLDFLGEKLGTGIELFTYKILDTMHSANVIQEAHKFAFGYDSQPFIDQEQGHPSVSLVAVSSSLGLSTEGAHGALADCKMCLESWRLMNLALVGDLRNSRLFYEDLERERERAEINLNPGATYDKPPAITQKS